jgi:hypothetical protein
MIKFVIAWMALSVIALGLILLRSDAYVVWQDINTYTRISRLFLRLVGIIMLIIVLPFSIPFSIANILNSNK